MSEAQLPVLEQSTADSLHLVLFGLAFGAYLVALHAAQGISARGLRAAMAMAVLWRLALIPAFPLLSDDVFRYVWEGRVQVQGEDTHHFRISVHKAGRDTPRRIETQPSFCV